MNDDRSSQPSEQDDIRELLGAYALDALDADERAAVEALLLVDQDARAELHALQLGAAWLERSAERPSPAVWGAVAKEMAADLGRADPGSGAVGADASVVAPLRRRTTVLTRTLALAAAFVAVIAVAGGVRTALDGPADVADLALASVVDEAGTRPDARAVVLETPRGTQALVAIVLKDGSGVAIPRDLPRLDDRRTYQLWALTADGPVSLGTMGAEPGARAFEDARGASRLAVTREPRGGSPQPTGTPVAVGNLS